MNNNNNNNTVELSSGVECVSVSLASYSRNRMSGYHQPQDTHKSFSLRWLSPGGLGQEEPVSGSVSLWSGVPFTVHRLESGTSRQTNSLVRVTQITRQWITRKMKKGRQ